MHYALCYCSRVYLISLPPCPCVWHCPVWGRMSRFFWGLMDNGHLAGRFSNPDSSRRQFPECSANRGSVTRNTATGTRFFPKSPWIKKKNSFANNHAKIVKSTGICSKVLNPQLLSWAKWDVWKWIRIRASTKLHTHKCKWLQPPHIASESHTHTHHHHHHHPTYFHNFDWWTNECL